MIFWIVVEGLSLSFVRRSLETALAHHLADWGLCRKRTRPILISNLLVRVLEAVN
jgi:hypothetical protein